MDESTFQKFSLFFFSRYIKPYTTLLFRPETGRVFSRRTQR